MYAGGADQLLDGRGTCPCANSAVLGHQRRCRGRWRGGTGWRVGETVAHAKFGEGVIVNIEGGAGAARAQINFGAAGMKVLDLSVAKLERIGR